MTDVAITPVELVPGARSIDLLGGGTAISSASGNVFAIAAGGRNYDRLILIFEADSTGDTVTILAGDRPPSQRADIGADTIVLAASDIRAFICDASKHLQNDGTIRATCTDDGTLCYALYIKAGINAV